MRIDALQSVRVEDIGAVAHRVVHGGPGVSDPVLLDDEAVTQIAEMSAVAPLHNAAALAEIEVARRRLGAVPHVAVFDTAFHATMPDIATTYAVPARWREEWGIRRLGFHGLSVEWSVERACDLLGVDGDALRAVICHLGGGCSVTAIAGGRSMDTTMGFTPLEGVPMTTRSGTIDPGALLYILRSGRLTIDELDRALNTASGVVGMSGRAGMREVERAAQAGDAEAGLAIDVFTQRVAGAVAAMAVSAGGMDALVFTAGIGEHSPFIRGEICGRLGPLGVEIDPTRNISCEPDADIASAHSRSQILVVEAYEEIVAARKVRELLHRSSTSAVAAASRRITDAGPYPSRSLGAEGLVP